MQTRNAHYSPNGHDVTITEFGFTHTAMGLMRKSEMAGAEAEVSNMTDAEVIAEFRGSTVSPRKLTKPERVAHEARRNMLTRTLTERGYCPDAIRWG